MTSDPSAGTIGLAHTGVATAINDSAATAQNSLRGANPAQAIKNEG